MTLPSDGFLYCLVKTFKTVFPGIDNTKRKKKIKKGLKSSSESDDDKKPKKKRKASASDLTGKEVKKKKPTKVASAAVPKSELFSEENLSDTDSKSAPATAKKPKSNFNFFFLVVLLQVDRNQYCYILFSSHDPFFVLVVIITASRIHRCVRKVSRKLILLREGVYEIY